MKKPKYEPDDGTLLDEDLAAIRESAATMLPSGKVISQRKHKLADLLAELPDGFEITDEMRAWMNMPEVGKEVWWRDGCGAGYLEFAAKLRSYIPDGDGYNSDYAKTLAAAADALEAAMPVVIAARKLSKKKRRRKSELLLGKLTRDSTRTVAERVEHDPAFAKALLDEAANLFLSGEPDAARLILRDLVVSKGE